MFGLNPPLQLILRQMSRYKILVLGSNGFIGKNIENYWTGFDDEFWSKNTK